jgi:hypothetical protein
MLEIQELSILVCDALARHTPRVKCQKTILISGIFLYTARITVAKALAD